MSINIEKIINSDFITYEGNDFRICFCSNGASIYSYSYKGHEWFFSPLDKSLFLNSKGFYGKTLGPIAGRYKLNNKVICHGGDNSISFMEFEYTYSINEDDFEIEFRLSLDKENTFYGNHCSYIVTYKVNENGEILIQYKIKAKEDTYASLSLHSYFNFLEEDVRNLKAKIKANEVSILNDDLSIKGFSKIGKAFDFKSPKLLKETYVEKENLTTRGHYLKGVNYPARIEDKGCALEIDSSFPSALIYLDSAPVGVIGLNNRKEKQFSCFVFEPEIDPENKDELLIKSNTFKSNWIKLSFFNN